MHLLRICKLNLNLLPVKDKNSFTAEESHIVFSSKKNNLLSMRPAFWMKEVVGQGQPWGWVLDGQVNKIKLKGQDPHKGHA